jgi:hypothetical protein
MGDETLSFGFFTNVESILIRAKWTKKEAS